MLIVIPISHVDLELAKLLLRRNLELGGCPQHEALLVFTERASSGSQELIELAKPGFKFTAAYVLESSNESGWPGSSNHLFVSTARFLERQGNVEPWYFMEADTTPLRERWASKLDEAYQTSGKQYLGVISDSFVQVNGQRTKIGVHMVGTGVYPANFLRQSRLIHNLGGVTRGLSPVPWDFYIQNEVVPKAAHTELIQHNWSTKNYREAGGQIVCDQAKPGLGNNNPVRRDAYLLHGCKDSSLFDLLSPKTEALPPPLPLPSRFRRKK